MSMQEYQPNLSLHSPILLDTEYKRPKIEKMLSILEDSGALAGDKPGSIAVDVGCSGGLFVSAIAGYFSRVYGADIDGHALSLAKRAFAAPNLLYLQGDSMRLPLPDCSADLIICNHVYEHVPDARILFREIFRILKPTGICYLGAASRLNVIEPHYHLPFLSWMPKPLAHFVMRVTGKGDFYYEKLRTLQGIRKLIADFVVDDYTLRVVADPDRFHARDLIPRDGLLDRIPGWVWRATYWLLPSYIFVLRKSV